MWQQSGSAGHLVKVHTGVEGIAPTQDRQDGSPPDPPQWAPTCGLLILKPYPGWEAECRMEGYVYSQAATSS